MPSSGGDGNGMATGLRCIVSRKRNGVRGRVGSAIRTGSVKSMSRPFRTLDWPRCTISCEAEGQGG